MTKFVKKKNILLFTRSMIPGGTEKEVQLLTKNIDKQHFNIYVASLNGQGAIAEDLIKNNFTVLDLTFSSFFHFIKVIRIFKNLYKFIKNKDIQIIHSFGYEPTIFGYILHIFSGVQFVSSQRNIYMIENDKRYKLFHIVLSKVNYILTNSYLVANTLKTSKISSENVKIKTIYNLVEQPQKSSSFRKEFFKKYNIAKDEIVIGTVSNLRGIKNPKLFFDVALELCKIKKNVRFISIGGGKLLSELKKEVKRNGLAKRINYLGKIDSANLFYNCMDIFILTSDSESSSMAILEAMNHGLPIVATNVGANNELVKDQVNGFLTIPKDKDSLLAKLNRIIDNKELRLEMSRNSQSIFKENFSLKKNIKNIEEFYHEVGSICV